MDSDLLKRNSIFKVVEKVKNTNELEICLNGFKILLKLLYNIMNEPTEDKYRYIKITNKTIQSTLMVLSNINELIIEIGFIELNDESYCYFNDNVFAIRIASSIIEQFVSELQEKVNMKNIAKGLETNPEVAKEKERIKQKIEEEKKAREEILDLIEEDKVNRKLRAKYNIEPKEKNLTKNIHTIHSSTLIDNSKHSQYHVSTVSRRGTGSHTFVAFQGRGTTISRSLHNSDYSYRGRGTRGQGDNYRERRRIRGEKGTYRGRRGDK